MAGRAAEPLKEFTSAFGGLKARTLDGSIWRRRNKTGKPIQRAEANAAIQNRDWNALRKCWPMANAHKDQTHQFEQPAKYVQLGDQKFDALQPQTKLEPGQTKLRGIFEALWTARKRPPLEDGWQQDKNLSHFFPFRHIKELLGEEKYDLGGKGVEELGLLISFVHDPANVTSLAAAINRGMEWFEVKDLLRLPDLGGKELPAKPTEPEKYARQMLNEMLFRTCDATGRTLFEGLVVLALEMKYLPATSITGFTKLFGSNWFQRLRDLAVDEPEAIKYLAEIEAKVKQFMEGQEAHVKKELELFEGEVNRGI